jgi:oligoribonuclease NrnB/cAMP/cGMP phosphodiesterase (DHH superfamily)
MKTVILYHANCYDGFGAAWAAWKKFGDKARYQPVQYGETPVSLDGDHEIYILDFTYPRAFIEDLRSRNARVVIIDHHKSAMKNLAGLGDTVFDLEKSAAVLAWEYFFPGAEVPRLLLYVQDYDLWKFELPNSKEVCIAVNSHPMDFTVWDGLDPDQLAKDGRPLLRLRKETVRMMCDEAKIVVFDGHEVPVVNASSYSSEVGEELLKRYPKAPFSVSFYDRADMRHWSLRSRPDFDVSVLARKYGGGGHLQAAGFETPLTDENFVPNPPTPVKPD